MSNVQTVVIRALKEAFPLPLVGAAMKAVLPFDIISRAFREGLILFFSPFVGFARTFRTLQPRQFTDEAVQHQPTSLEARPAADSAVEADLLTEAHRAVQKANELAAFRTYLAMHEATLTDLERALTLTKQAEQYLKASASFETSSLLGRVGRHVLSARDNEVLALIATGCSPEEIATALNISVTTVRSYLEAARRKLSQLDDPLRRIEMERLFALRRAED